MLDLLREPRVEPRGSPGFADLASAEIYATLLDEGAYQCSIPLGALAPGRTMYRILAEHGAVRERRDQLRHPVYQKPELLAEAPNQVWSWDITKLMGPAKWSCFHLYVILDIFSRRVVGWCVADAESATLFKALFDDTLAKHAVLPGQLTLHADRGGPMKAKATALMLADLGVTKSHSRPHTLRMHRRRQGILPRLLHLVQPAPPSRRHRPDDPRSGPLRTSKRRPRRPPADPRPRLPGQSGTLRPQTARTPRRANRHWINPPQEPDNNQA